MTLIITTLCHYAESYYAEHRALFILMLNVIMPSVDMLSVATLNVVILSVEAPFRHSGSLPSVCVEIIMRKNHETM